MKVTDSPAVIGLRQAARRHPLWKHPFLRRCASGHVTLPEVRILAGQMYKFTREFSRLLAKIMAYCPDEPARVVVAENLFEELGEGDLQRTHAELFRRFTRALRITDADLERTPAEPETRALIDTYFGLPERHGYLAALGAVCFASEGIVTALYSQLQKGIERAVPLPADALVFFALHVQCDTGHAAQLVRVLEPHLGDARETGRIATAVGEALDARLGFFNGIQRRACTVMDVTAPLWGAREVTSP